MAAPGSARRAVAGWPEPIQRRSARHAQSAME